MPENKKLVAFIYYLMMNHISPDSLENLICQVNEPNVQLTNSWILQYSESIVERLIEGN